MVISPVSNIVTKNNYNVEFGSKKNKGPQNEGHRSSSGMKAVPVVVLMAMSPLMANNIKAADRIGNENNIELVSGINEKSQNSEKVIRVKDFKIGNTDCKVKFRSENDDNCVSQIIFSGPDPKTGHFSHYYDEFNNIKLDIVGDDGKTSKTVEFMRIMGSVVPGKIRRNYNQKQCQYVKDFIDGKIESDLKSAIKIKDVNRKIRPGDNGDLQNVPNKTDWIAKGAAEKENFGETPKGMPEYVTVYSDDDIFFIRPYTTDENNKEGFQAVTVMSMRLGSEFKVAGLRTSKIKLTGNDDEIGTFDLNTIELYKRNSKEKARIIDDKLFKVLLEVTNDTRFDNAFECHPITSSNIMLYGDALVSPVN